MNSPLLPQPAAQTCPHCGAAVGEGVALCPNCGTALAMAGKGGGCLVIGAQIVLVLLALGFGLGGACFVFLGGINLPGLSATSGATFTELLPFIGGGLLGLVLAAACVWGVIKLGKRRR